MSTPSSPPASDPPPASAPPPDRTLLWHTLRITLIVAAVGALIAVVMLAAGVFLLAFGGIVIAVMLRTPSVWISRHTGMPPRWALALVILVALAVIGVSTWYAVPPLIAQANQLLERIPVALSSVDDWLTSIGLGTIAIQDLLPGAAALAGRLPGIVTTTFGSVGGLLVMIVLGVYLAATPREYRDGFLRLAAVERRENVRATLDRMATVLHRWILGQLVCMAFVGIAAYAALTLLGVPLAFGLAVLAGVLEFVPYLGPIVAAVPVVLVAGTESWELALYALIAFTVIQQIESYVVTPMVQRRAVYLPPALLIFLQLLLGVLFGLVGVILATPIAAVGLVLVERAYVRAVIEKPAEDGLYEEENQQAEQPASNASSGRGQ